MTTMPIDQRSRGELTVRPDRRFIRTTWRSNRFVLLDLTAPPARPREDPDARPSANLAFVVDRSGSMAGEKIRLARKAVEEGIARLQPTDRFAVIVYDQAIDVVADSQPATPENRRRALARLTEIDARGNTALAEGWLRGAEQVAKHLAERGVNRVLLLTDGLANVGIKDPQALARHAAELRARGVATSTFGVGADFDEHLLNAMADAGGGHFYYIESAAQIVDFITSEVGEVLDVVARDATVLVTHGESMRVESLSPFRWHASPGSTSILLGDLVADQHLQVVLRVTFPFGDLGRQVGATFAVSDADEAFGGAPEATLTWEYADDRTNDRQERDTEVDRVVARIFAARAREKATLLNKQGRFDEARAHIEAVARRIRAYAGRDPEMLGIVASLEADGLTLEAPMAPAALKGMYMDSRSISRSRDWSGRAQRRSRE